MPVLLTENRIQDYGPNCVLAAGLRDLAAIEDAGWVIAGTPAIVTTPWGRGMEFDGTADYIQCVSGAAPGNILIPDTFSVECLIKLNSQGENPILRFGTTTTPIIGAQWGTTRAIIYMGPSNYRYFDHSPVNIIDGGWHHLIFTMPGSAQLDIDDSVMYADGQAQTVNSTNNTGPQAGKTACFIGYFAGGAARWFNGTMKFINLYNTVLTANDALRRYERVIGAIQNP